MFLIDPLGQLIVAGEGRGSAVFGTGSFSTTYAPGQLDFGVKGNTSNGRIILQSKYVEVGDIDHFSQNVYTKGGHNETLFVQDGI